MRVFLLAAVLLFTIPAVPDEPIKGNKTSIWVRRWIEDKSILVVEPVYTPELILRPVKGSSKLVAHLGGVTTCQNLFVIVTWTNDHQETGKLHRLDCDGEVWEVMTVNLKETK